MSVAPGTTLGPYEILAPLGSGGMGEVYRARDTRLGRDVAIKVLASHLARDTDAGERFVRETRIVASLSHPNIVAIHDTGTTGDISYAVMELLEGQTLGERLAEGPLPVRKALDIAAQVADALGAAHDRGVVHRDLKPANVFLASDGRTKVLDFGLAHRDPHASADLSALQTMEPTQRGMVLGTIGYMAPEQVRGQDADRRADVFAFGCTLYEMLCGRRAFGRQTLADTMAAILREDPPPLTDVRPPLPPALVRLVERCLEKEPAQRFQSMQDLAFALRALAAPDSSGQHPSLAPRNTGAAARRVAVTAAMVVVAAVLGYLVQGFLNRASMPLRFERLTFRQGTIFSARFTPDGNSVVYGAAWSGRPVELYSTRIGGRESRPLQVDADVLGISSAGEMALSVGRSSLLSLLSTGRLARASLSGGAPREVLDGIVDADWSPDGSAMAVTREVEGEARLEYPIGRVLDRGPGYFSAPRISPDGTAVAFIEHPVKGDDRGGVTFIADSAEPRQLTIDMPSVTGLAWSPDGREIWFSAMTGEDGNSIQAVTPAGERRMVASLGQRARLFDVLGSRALLGFEAGHTDAAGLLRGDDVERDLSWLDGTVVMDISTTGDRLLFIEGWEGGGAGYSFFVRQPGRDEPVRLGDGFGAGLSPDGRYVVGYAPDPPARLSIVPTGPGESRTVDLSGFEVVSGAGWFSDGVRLLVWTNKPGEAVGAYVTDINGSAPRPITGPGAHPPVWVGAAQALSPDGRFLAASGVDGAIRLFPVDGGEPGLVPGVRPGEEFVAWLGDQRHVLVRKRSGLPNHVFRVSLDTGQREPWKDLMPANPEGVLDLLGIVTTRDGQHYAYSYLRALTSLYLVEGLR